MLDQNKGVSFKVLSSRIPELNEVVCVIDNIESHSDREIAIIGANVIDIYLRKCLLSRFRKLSKDNERKIFDSNGPLSNFSGKISICHALKIINDQTFSELGIIRNIRNGFAHSLSVVSIPDSECQNLKAIDDYKNHFNEEFKSGPEEIS